MALPKIIAGPILRRVDPNNVSVWLACTQNFDLTLKLYDGFEIDTSNPAGLVEIATTSALAQTIQVGKHLWISVVTAKPQVGLQSSNIYSYNITFQSPTDSSINGDFRSEGLLKDGIHNGRKQLPIGYNDNKLPSFALSNEDPEKLFVVQASCRKMHGHGLDALGNLDKIIDDNHKLADKRPQQLFLTGDQVYADDVPGPFLVHCGTIESLDIGLEETVQVDRPNGSTDNVKVDRKVWPPYLRQHLVNKVAGLTSGSASNHVISFTEYANLYLAYWSNRAWNLRLINEIKKIQDDNKDSVLEAVADELLGVRVKADGTLEVVPAGGEDTLWNLYNKAHADGVFGDNFALTLSEEKKKLLLPTAGATDDTRKKVLNDLRRKLKAELKDMANFADALPKVSRVLANVPSYMIFDDHEVTDDWYLNKRWNNQVLSKRLGRDIIRNGLMAYAVFQDWGNMPEEYVPEPQPGETAASIKPRTKLLREIIKYCKTLADNTASTIPRPASTSIIESLLGLGAEPSKVKWHYSVRTGPTTTFVLDTRTRRQYDSLNAPPGLLTKEALEEQIPAVNPVGSVPFSIVVSPAPAPGLATFEELIQPAGAAIAALSSIGDINENSGIFKGMIDVDYEAWGFNVKAIEQLIERLSKHKKVIIFSGDVHFGFSSVLDYWKGSNAIPEARILTFTSSAAKNEEGGEKRFLVRPAIMQKLLTGLGDNIEKLGWNNRVLSITGPASIKNRQRLRNNPAVIPVAGWRAGSTINRQPDYRWRLKILTDERKRNDDPITLDIDLDDDTSTAEGYEKTTARHLLNFISGVHRRMIWSANIGLLRFEGTGNDLMVKHDFLFTAGSRVHADTTPGSHIQHQARLLAEDTDTVRPVLP